MGADTFSSSTQIEPMYLSQFNASEDIFTPTSLPAQRATKRIRVRYQLLKWFTDDPMAATQQDPPRCTPREAPADKLSRGVRLQDIANASYASEF
ncbi:hypothetical protein SS50377_27303 [Spironucleus salmonicida]|uniref:Uncharacterized protein n=1 Tax=Spironucleus salmonicida TaxID=348837 RepID=A0A9P8RVQ0_9EUKA|nr:hypothetical protein SS50377_27303 [Spironucleus salmonicida]